MDDIAIIAIFRTYLVFNAYDDGGYYKSSGGLVCCFEAEHEKLNFKHVFVVSEVKDSIVGVN